MENLACVAKLLCEQDLLDKAEEIKNLKAELYGPEVVCANAYEWFLTLQRMCDYLREAILLWVRKDDGEYLLNFEEYDFDKKYESEDFRRWRDIMEKHTADIAGTKSDSESEKTVRTRCAAAVAAAGLPNWPESVCWRWSNYVSGKNAKLIIYFHTTYLENILNEAIVTHFLNTTAEALGQGLRKWLCRTVSEITTALKNFNLGLRLREIDEDDDPLDDMDTRERARFLYRFVVVELMKHIKYKFHYQCVLCKKVVVGEYLYFPEASGEPLCCFRDSEGGAPLVEEEQQLFSLVPLHVRNKSVCWSCCGHDCGTGVERLHHKELDAFFSSPLWETEKWMSFFGEFMRNNGDHFAELAKQADHPRPNNTLAELLIFDKTKCEEEEEELKSLAPKSIFFSLYYGLS